MEIRLAKPEDLRSIMNYDRHIHPDRLEKCVDDEFVYVLCADGNVVGVLRYSLFWQSIPFLDLLYIDETWQGKGCGKYMMACWESVMGKRGYDHVMLSTQEDETAKFFYEKLGYRRIGAFLPPDQDANELMYLKDL